jgi:serine/threonine protein kinase
VIQKGKILKSDSGRRIRVDGLIKAGGQGEAYGATEINSSQKGVVKLFHKRFRNDDTVKRLRFLVDQDLCSACPVIAAPVDVLNRANMIGHYTPFAAGAPLEEFLGNPNSTFIENLQLAITLAHAIAIMHARQIAHGDLHAENLIINRVGSVFQLHVIDLDNYNAPGMPLPPCVGHNLYMAPELRAALAKGLAAIPTVETDRFSLGVLMHEIILLRHVSAGNDDNEEHFQKAMCSGRWLQDPAAADKPTDNIGGYPVEVLNADLARLFRSALSLDPAKRPTANVWEVELGRAFNSVFCCPKCGGPCVIDISKVSCPLCNSSFPHLTLQIRGNGHTIPLTQGATVVGRTELGGSMKASSRHVVFRRLGPETWIESLGSNGTYRWNGSAWTRLPDKKPLLVQNGDRLRFGDVEAQVN